jgi:hypothetical protein
VGSQWRNRPIIGWFFNSIYLHRFRSKRFASVERRATTKYLIEKTTDLTPSFHHNGFTHQLLASSQLLPINPNGLTPDFF